MHICYLSLAFFTMMTSASQVEYLTSLMKLALRSLSTSSLTTLCCSSPIFLLLCDIGFAWGQMASLWKIMLGWIPGMLDEYQASRSVFLCRTLVMRLCSWLVRSLLSSIHCLGLGSSYNLMSSSIGFGPLSEVSSHKPILNLSSRLIW